MLQTEMTPEVATSATIPATARELTAYLSSTLSHCHPSTTPIIIIVIIPQIQQDKILETFSCMKFSNSDCSAVTSVVVSVTVGSAGVDTSTVGSTALEHLELTFLGILRPTITHINKVFQNPTQNQNYSKR